MPQGSIPQQRVVEKLDEYMSRRDYAGAERHLRYWLDEARALGDARGELMLRNELVGHYRKVGDRAQALLHADEALRLLAELDMESSISAGTTYTNVATACSAFGEDERALGLFRKAAALYRGSAHTQPRLLGGLYNNMALACTALRRFDEADELYAQALAVMETVENGELEQAITYLNMADAAVARYAAAMWNAARAQCQTGANPNDEEAEPNAIDALEVQATPMASMTPATPVMPGAPATPDAPATPATSAAPYAEGEAAALQDPACAQLVDDHLARALALLNAPQVPRDGYYAFVCEKCAPVFGHYGYFLADDDLRERARSIYERA